MSIIALIAVCFLITIPIVIGVWLGLRLTGRQFALKRSHAPQSRMLLVGLIVSAAVIVGFWIGNRGNWDDPIALYAMAAGWLVAMAATFCTVKKA